MRRVPSRPRAIRLAAVLALAALSAIPRVGSGAGMDIMPQRLVIQPPGLPAGSSCQSVAQNPEQALSPPFPAAATPNDYPCLPNNVAWANLMSELGMAIAPVPMHPARTVGPGGLSLTLQASVTSINANAIDKTGTAYWHLGTQGAGGGTNTNPDAVLALYSLVFRKGLPFGLEVSGTFGYLANTSLLVEGGDLRWALLEGFRTGTFRNVPDVAIGASVRTVTGAASFSMTAVGIDAEVSKPVTVGGRATITPYGGLQRVIVFAQSDVVDLTPSVDPLQQCGWQGSNVPGNPNGHAPYDGSPLCANKLSNGMPADADFANDRAFDSVTIHRWRGFVGADYKIDIWSFGAQLAVDLTQPSAENGNIGVSGDRQWTGSFQAGVTF